MSQYDKIRSKFPLGNVNMNQNLPPRSLSQTMKDNFDRSTKQKSNISLNSNDSFGSQKNNKENLASSTNHESSRRSSAHYQNNSISSSSVLKQNNMSQALKQSQQYNKQSIIYKCIQQSIEDLVCQKHMNQEIQYFCSTCKVLLCHHCLSNEGSCLEQLFSIYY